MNYTAIKADFKLIIREPILVLFMFVPLMVLAVFKLAVVFLLPWVYNMTGFEYQSYLGYLLVTAILLTPGMLGTVMGFLMIDERDSKIYELMSVTPGGYSGYITNRLLLPFVLGIVYTFIGYYTLNIFTISFPMLLYVALLAGVEGMLFGIILFRLADDKVKGMTYSKALSGVIAFAYAELLENQWINIVATLFPFYWVSRLVINPDGIMTVLTAAAVHVLWFGIIYKSGKKI